MQIQKTPLSPTYKKDNGVFVINIDSVTLPDGFNAVKRDVVSVPPKQLGGNHKHPRVEIFIALTENLTMVWQNEKGETTHEQMYVNGQLMQFLMPPMISHAIVNTSESETGFFIEFSNAEQSDVTRVSLV